jgi:hypothetical protein
MTDATFRALALAQPEATEMAHFGKADFRVHNKIFAGFNGDGTAYVKLTPDQQEMICASEALVTPIAGGGKGGRRSITRGQKRHCCKVCCRLPGAMSHPNRCRCKQGPIKGPCTILKICSDRYRLLRTDHHHHLAAFQTGEGFNLADLRHVAFNVSAAPAPVPGGPFRDRESAG